MFQIASILSSKTLILKISLNIIICTFSSHQLVAQGNYRFENFGNRSILLNGNVTGSVEDLGLTFYNPSRLALVDDPSFTITGKAYELNDISLSNAIGSNKGLSSSKFKGIPSMVAGTFRVKSWDKHYFAYSFISRYRSRLNLGYTGRLNDFGQIGPNDDIINEAIEIRLKNSIEDEWIGLSWATKLNNHLAIGASLFLSLYEFEGNSDLSYYSDRSNAVLSYGNDILYNQKTNGLFLKLGASWIVRGFEMGLNVHLPYFNIRDKAKFNYKEILSGMTPTEDFIRIIKLEDLSNARKTALGISYGTGIKWKRNKIHLNLEWFGGVKNYSRIRLPQNEDLEFLDIDFNERLNSVVNFGIGAEIYISSKISGFTSFSSDFSAYDSNANLFDIINDNDSEINDQSDFWHFGLGIDLNFKWGDVILGGVYSVSETNFEQSISIPINNSSIVENENSRLNINRYRFIIGLEIPLIMNKVGNIITQ